MRSAALEITAPAGRRYFPRSTHSEFARTPEKRLVRWAVFATMALLAISLPGIALAEPPNASPRRHNNRHAKATSSSAARESAVRSIPFDKLPEESRRKVAGVIRNTTVFRRLPVQLIDCNPDLYVFLTENPDVVVDIWKLLGVSDVALKRSDQNCFEADDGEGTAGKIEYLYKSHDTHIVYAEGTYDGKLFQRPVSGRCLLVLRSGYVRETNDRYYITCRMDTFISLDHLGAEVLARTFQPLIGKTADYNFLETTAFMASLSRTAEVNPGGIVRITSRLTDTSPEARQRLVSLCDKITAEAAVARTASRNLRPPASRDENDVLVPFRR